MHHLISEYYSDPGLYNRRTVAKMVLACAARDRFIGLEDEIVKAVQPFMGCKDLFKEILTQLENIPREDLQKIVDDMPSGWERAQIMMYLDTPSNP